MLEEKVPLDKINNFIERVKTKQKKESYGKDIGTALHEWIDLFLKGKKPTIFQSEPLKSMAKNFKTFGKNINLKLLLVNYHYIAVKFDMCGTNDVIVTKQSWKGQLAVLDWKTSKDYNFENAIQVEMYRRFIEETTDFKIQKLAIVNIPKENGQRCLVFYV